MAPERSGRAGEDDSGCEHASVEQTLRDTERLLAEAEALRAALEAEALALMVELTPWAELRDGLSGEAALDKERDEPPSTSRLGRTGRQLHGRDGARRLREQAQRLSDDLRLLKEGRVDWQRGLRAWDASVRQWMLDARDWGDELPPPRTARRLDHRPPLRPPRSGQQAGWV